MADITHIYWGTREAMVAEVAAWDPVENEVSKPSQAKYLLLPSNGQGNFDPEWASSRKEMRAAAHQLADILEAHQGFRPEVRYIY